MNGTILQTTSDDVTLMWNDHKSRLKVPLGNDNNVATFHMACGFSKFDEFCLEAKIEDEEVIIGEESPLTIEESTTQKRNMEQRYPCKIPERSKRKRSSK